MEDFIYEKLKAAVERLEKMSADEFFEMMRARGVIDEKGRVLLRIPEVPGEDGPPEEPGPPVKRRRRRS
jgi:hypothetical protein